MLLTDDVLLRWTLLLLLMLLLPRRRPDRWEVLRRLRREPDEVSHSHEEADSSCNIQSMSYHNIIDA